MKSILIFLILLSMSCSTKNEKPKQAHTFLDSTNLEKSNYDSISSKSYFLSNLSPKFDLNVFYKRFIDADDCRDSCIVKIAIAHKNNATIFDSISVTSTFYFSSFFQDSSKFLSYSTRVNLDKQVIDNYYGDIIVVDFNFDNKDDIAVINDDGGNGGPLYSYFIQNSQQKFLLDQFLTDSMAFFPTKINRKRKTLVTYVRAGACCMGQHIYRFDVAKNKWAQTSHKILGLDK